MDQAEFDQAAAAFAAFHQSFAPLFGRKEARQRSEQYVRGLLVQQTDRRNAENIAEAVDGATPRTLQRLLTEAPWETAPVIDALHAYLAPRLSTPDGVFVLDESGFPKKGDPAGARRSASPANTAARSARSATANSGSFWPTSPSAATR